MSLKEAAQYIRAQGRGKDTELVHLTKREVRALEGLAEAAGGKVTRNPETGLPEAGFLDSLLPTLLGFGANLIVPGSGVIVGGLTGAMQNKENPLMGAIMGGIGGYGGGQLANGIGGMAAASPQLAGAAIQNPALTSAVGTGAGSQASMLAAQNAGFGMDGITHLAQAGGGAAPTATGFAGAGLQAAAQNPMNYVQELGGMQPAAKAAGYAAAPMLAGMGASSGGSEKPDWANAEGSQYEYEAGYTGGTPTGPDPSSERRWFDPQYKRLASGGSVDMESGGFVIPADVVSMAGGGSTDAGLAALSARTGARPIKGGGTGLSDDIPARIDGKPMARVANGEAYVPRENVKKMGGARKLYKAMERIRTQAHGKPSQQRPVNVDEAFA